MDIQNAESALVTMRDFVGFHTTVTITGAWLVVYGADRFVAVWQRWSWVPWTKSRGLTAAMVQRFNLALILFLPLTIFGGVLNLIKPIPELTSYYQAYRPLHVLLASICAGLILFNFAQMVSRAVEQGAVNRLWTRLAYAYRGIDERGVKLFPLVATPIVFFLPAEYAIDWVRDLIVAP